MAPQHLSSVPPDRNPNDDGDIRLSGDGAQLSGSQRLDSCTAITDVDEQPACPRLGGSVCTRVADVLGHQADDPDARVEIVYQLALSRLPTDMERRLGIETLEELQAVQQSDPQAALETYCHTVLNSAAFLYVD